MNLSEPTLFRRSDKSRPSRNTFLGDIEQYFAYYNSACVHFGRDRESDRYYVIKLLKSDEEIDRYVDCDEVIRSLDRLYPCRDYETDFCFFNNYGIDYRIVIIDDDCNWRLENNYVVTVDFRANGYVNDESEKIVNVMSQKEFQRDLVDKFGINRTRKPLIYATTEFEGFLSDVSQVGCVRGDITLFPGDADLITYSGNLECLNVFEFKKHTPAGGDSTLGEQSFYRYIERDRKKYAGIAGLSKYLGKDYFFNVTYSTRRGEERIIKIEQVDANRLTLVKQTIIEFYDRESFIGRIKIFTDDI